MVQGGKTGFPASEEAPCLRLSPALPPPGGSGSWGSRPGPAADQSGLHMPFREEARLRDRGTLPRRWELWEVPLWQLLRNRWWAVLRGGPVGHGRSQLACGSLRQEDHEFKTSLEYIARLHLRARGCGNSSVHECWPQGRPQERVKRCVGLTVPAPP